jgi:hypothetical protein
LTLIRKAPLVVLVLLALLLVLPVAASAGPIAAKKA